MPLLVGFVAGDARFQAATLNGSFRVDSLAFDVGTLHLALADVQVTAQLDSDGNVSSTFAEPMLGSSATLERLAL